MKIIHEHIVIEKEREIKYSLNMGLRKSGISGYYVLFIREPLESKGSLYSVIFIYICMSMYIISSVF